MGTDAPDEAPPAPGDRILATPSARAARLGSEPLAGVVVDAVNGGDGYNIHCPPADGSDPTRTLRLWRRDYTFAVVERAAPVVCSPRPAAAPVPYGSDNRLDPESWPVWKITADYRRRGLDLSHAWSQFVIDRGLRPEVDMREFRKYFDK